MSLPQAWLDELRARTVLSTLIGRSVKITRAGREWKACCPFHNEKTPSFTINDEKGFGHCFGCGAHVDAIRWMTDHHGMPFMDAVRELADAAGMEVPQRSPEAAAKAARIDGLRPALERAAAFYAAELAGAGAAREYLFGRGFDADAIARYGLGYAPGRRGHISALGITPQAALDAGLLWRDDATGRSGEFFRQRIMIPVHDARGRIVGFAGRAGDGVEPKYKNSPATEIFDKGRVLFNAHRAAALVRDLRSRTRDTPSPSAGASGVSGGSSAPSSAEPASAPPACLPGDGALRDLQKRLFIVEGQFDALALDMAGIPAGAPMGTALTEAQLEQAWRIGAPPLALFDGDAAGVKAARRACETALPALSPGRDLHVAACPDGEDPASLMASDGGRAALWRVASQARSCERWLFSAVIEQMGTADDGDDDPVAAATAWEELEALAATIRHVGVREQIHDAWRARFAARVAVSRSVRRETPVVPHGMATPDKSAADAAAVLVAADDEGEDQLRRGVRAILRLREQRRAITDDIAAARSILKALGYDMKAISRLITDLESDATHGPALREDVEAIWATYRRVMGVSGPISEGLLPAITEAARGRAVTIASKKLARQAALIEARPARALPMPMVQQDGRTE